MAAVTTTSSASDIQADYMKLLVTQLQNQDPMDPLDNKDMSAQLAQFSQLQQTENLNTSFTKVLDLVQRSYASSLIGKEVSFASQADDGTTQTSTGPVEQVTLGDNETVLLTVNGQQIDLANVASIRS
jgi:flagellar basal-body rod modification protein FlgD